MIGAIRTVCYDGGSDKEAQTAICCSRAEQLQYTANIAGVRAAGGGPGQPRSASPAVSHSTDTMRARRGHSGATSHASDPTNSRPAALIQLKPRIYERRMTKIK